MTAAEDAEASDLMLDSEVAKLLLVATQTLANRRARGEGPPYIKLGSGRIRYRRAEVLAWLEESTIR